MDSLLDSSKSDYSETLAILNSFKENNKEVNEKNYIKCALDVKEYVIEHFYAHELYNRIYESIGIISFSNFNTAKTNICDMVIIG